MLSINLSGARALLDLLARVSQGQVIQDADLDAALEANAFFVDFYSGWDGCDRESIRRALVCFSQPGALPAGSLQARMAEGFRQAVGEMNLLRGRMDWLSGIDPSAVAGRVLALLPAGTPLDTVIHITVDAINNAFACRRAMGVSLLKAVADQKTFEEVVSHELHHTGVRCWSDQDPIQQALLKEHSGRSVAVMHVLNLLMEGMANGYLTPGYVFRANPDEPSSDPYQARLARMCREEGAFFARAGAVLHQALEPGAGYEECIGAFKVIALDMEDYMLPAGHYLGARMVQIMDQAHPREKIVACVKRLQDFLPLYNQAARRVGGYVFAEADVERFAAWWA